MFNVVAAQGGRVACPFHQRERASHYMCTWTISEGGVACVEKGSSSMKILARNARALCWPVFCMFKVLANECRRKKGKIHQTIQLTKKEQGISSSTGRRDRCRVGSKETTDHTDVVSGILNYKMFHFVPVDQRCLASSPTSLARNVMDASEHRGMSNVFSDKCRYLISPLPTGLECVVHV